MTADESTALLLAANALRDTAAAHEAAVATLARCYAQLGFGDEEPLVSEYLAPLREVTAGLVATANALEKCAGCGGQT